METKKRKKRKALVDENFCVACGCCVKVCPMAAIQVPKGIAAKVDFNKCVGCGKCAKECPASVIVIQEVEDEKEMVWLFMGGIYDLPYSGIFQHPFCVAGFTLLFHPSDHLSDKRKQRILQPLLRQGTAVWTAGRFLWTVPKKRHSQMDEKQMVPLRISVLFPCYVSANALELVSGLYRCQKSETGSHTFVDL